MVEFSYTDLLPLGHDETTYRKIAEGGAEATQSPLTKNEWNQQELRLPAVMMSLC